MQLPKQHSRYSRIGLRAAKPQHSRHYLIFTKNKIQGVEIVNATVAGGNGSAALPVLQARLLGGNPPDTWQTHPGSELFNRYVAAGKCEPVTELYASEGWLKVVTAQL